MTALRITAALGAAILAGAGSTSPRSPARVGARTHEIRMIGDASGYRFEPANVSIAQGDTVVFLVVSGQPHTVAFDTTAIAPAVARTLGMRMHDKIGTLSGPLLLASRDRYVIDFAGMPAGRYPFVCLPHAALKMAGEIVVR
jgi:plastocyanin